MADDRHYVIQARTDSEKDRVDFMLKNMAQNKAYRYALEKNSAAPSQLLDAFKQRYLAYRSGWRDYPKAAFAAGLGDTYVRTTGHPPLCVDIETAAVCDLACPFCFRQSIATPDKIMSEELFNKIMDQCEELKVPSIKLNWRGEPLLNPLLHKFIDRAKRAGVLEVIINTNAVTLSQDRAKDLIEAGLDLMIFSFDGGTKETYERMRVGRFKENTFAAVYENIQNFAKVRQGLGSPFPRTKIQMILTNDTFAEQDSFFATFGSCVDDVSVKAYTERGGALPELDEQTRHKLTTFLQSRNLPSNTPYWRDMSGRLFVSERRLPCEQPFQRLMITFDGSVSMCCYDWGNEHPVGYLEAAAYERRDQNYNEVIAKSQKKAKGFALLQDLARPRLLSKPQQKVSTLAEIWDGPEINAVRKAHAEDRFNDVKICSHCNFKETYQWIQVPQ